MKKLALIFVFCCLSVCAEETWTDKDGKEYRVAGHNAKDSEVMVIDGKRYCKAGEEFEPDIIVDEQPYCLIGSMRRRKETKAECVRH